jgi:hypothetical protein
MWARLIVRLPERLRLRLQRLNPVSGGRARPADVG